jgi:hypothetical protein
MQKLTPTHKLFVALMLGACVATLVALLGLFFLCPEDGLLFSSS